MRNCLKCPAYRVNELLMAECAINIPKERPDDVTGLGCRLACDEVYRAIEERESDDKH